MARKNITSREMILGVHINLPSEIARHIRQSQKGVANYFGSQDFHPHLTVYLARCSTTAYKQFVKDLRQSPRPAPLLRFTSLLIDPLPAGGCFIGLSFARTKNIVSFHQYILDTANPKRKGLLRHKDKERLLAKLFTAREKKMLLKNGYARTGPLFRPHITIGTITQVDQRKSLGKIQKHLQSLKNISWQPKSFVVGLYPYNLQSEKYEKNYQEQEILFQ